MKKAIYSPKGKAGEYAAFACNFYRGCSNGCEYCYLKRFPLLSSPEPVLRNVFASEAHALAQFNRELYDRKGNVREDLRREGVTFSFTTDPMLDRCIELTSAALLSCLTYNIPATILTKCVAWTESNRMKTVLELPQAKRLLAIGFTITGHDGMEPHAAPNEMRIRALRDLHRRGFLTYVSVEPVFFFDTALQVIQDCAPYARLLKVGLKSGARKCKDDTLRFIGRVGDIVNGSDTRVYWKRSIRDCAGGDIPFNENFVESDWNIFRK